MGKVTSLFKGRPLRQLTHGMSRTGGRNNQGRITSFHRGGGAKRLFRVIDMKRNVPDLTGTVERIEYDPFRTGRTALIRWEQEQHSTSTSAEGLDDGEGKRKVVRVKDLPRGALPRGIHDLPRTALRSAVATICGLKSVPRKVKEPMTVVIDGRKKLSSLAGEASSKLPSYLGFTKKGILDMHHTNSPSTNSLVELTLGCSASKVAFKDAHLDAQQKTFNNESETNTTLPISRGLADFGKGALRTHLGDLKIAN